MCQEKFWRIRQRRHAPGCLLLPSPADDVLIWIAQGFLFDYSENKLPGNRVLRLSLELWQAPDVSLPLTTIIRGSFCSDMFLKSQRLFKVLGLLFPGSCQKDRLSFFPFLPLGSLGC